MWGDWQCLKYNKIMSWGWCLGLGWQEITKGTNCRSEERGF